MTDFHLRKFIREVLDTSDADSPRSLAQEVLKRLDDTQIREALEQALPLVCQNFLSKERGSLIAPSPQRELVGVGASTPRQKPRPARMSSWKNNHGAPREYWEARLDELFAYGPNEWCRLGDCTVKIFERMVEWRESLGRKNFAEAAGGREWIDLLKQYEAESAAQLPKDVLRQRLSGAA